MERHREQAAAAHPAAPGPARLDGVKIVQIVGTIYSGSTITNIVLGNHPAIAACGEMDNAPQLFLANRYRCACGADPGDCPFWNDVRRRWEAATGAGMEDFAALQRRYERFSRFPLALYNFLFPSRDFCTYLDYHARLYQAVAAVSGRRILVDASKNPVRALNLTRRFRRQSALVHLVKDGRAFLWSMKKRKHDARRVDTFFKTTVFYDVLVWLFVNGTSSLVCRLYPRGQKAFIRNERLLPGLKAGLRGLEPFLAVDCSALAETLDGGSMLEPQHSMSGNAIRMRENLRLSPQPDETWREALHPLERLVFFLCGGSLLNLYWRRRDAA